MSVSQSLPPEDAPDPVRRRAGGVAQLLAQLSRRVLERRDAEDLHAAQWSALRYFDRAGRRAATVMGLSTYLGNTTGSASRTVRSLTDRGLIVGEPLREDARSVGLTLTPRGRAMLERDPLNDVTDALCDLTEDDLARLGDLLDRLQQAIAERRQ